MGLEHGHDFVFCHKTMFIAGGAPADMCLIGTRDLIAMIPIRIDRAVWNSHVTTTTFQLGDEAINDGLQRTLASPALTIEELHAVMRKTAAGIQEARLIEIATMKRLRVRCGFLSKGVYWSQKEKGPGWEGCSLKGKPLAQQWLAFYQGLPNFVS